MLFNKVNDKGNKMYTKICIPIPYLSYLSVILSVFYSKEETFTIIFYRIVYLKHIKCLQKWIHLLKKIFKFCWHKKIIVFCLDILFIQIQIFAQLNLSKKSKAEIEHLIKKMTLEEKVTMIHGKANFLSGGIPRLGIPPLNPSDGPHGVRMELNKNWEPLNN